MRKMSCAASLGVGLLLGSALWSFGETLSAGTWTVKASMPVGMAEVGVAALDGKIYVVGGTEGGKNAPPRWDSTLNEMYDPARDVWQERAPLPRGLTHVGAAAMGGKLYAIGGFTNIVHMGAQNLGFVYDPGANKWTELPRFSTPRGSVAAVAISGKLHIFGGRGSDKAVKISKPNEPDLFLGLDKPVNTHEVYDPTTDEWSLGSPVPGPGRDHMGVVMLDGKVHLFGGRTADVADNIDRHDVYDPQTNIWTTAAPLPRARSSAAYTTLKGFIVYAGGECKPGGQPFTPNAFDDVTAYDVKVDHWISLTPLPHARHAFGAATVDDVAYFAGGAPVCGGGASTDMLALTF
jgi:N-acetylneuraminic acid mutarotase